MVVLDLQSNADLKQRLEAMAQLQQETLKSYAADSVYGAESNGESHGLRDTPSADSRTNDKDKARRSALQKRVVQLEAANQVRIVFPSMKTAEDG